MMNARNDLSTILVNLALQVFPPVLEDEERHPEYIRSSGRDEFTRIRPLGWLYLAHHHPEVVARFDRERVDAVLERLGYRFARDRGKPVPNV